MKNMKNLLIFILTLIVQFSNIILAMVLEDFSTKQMGVARYGNSIFFCRFNTFVLIRVVN
ncbi:hypothetical protein RCG17_00860 [Neobacillus sp. PS3-12]|uniref:hypothetical protein n=1 Tax=Neobacillus sp. PS3-12 TaxID=3070677 RepID=UPI0027555828|nr:hypothetical protein [Neobacillus sp. PS3-12]MDP4107774.1 hypothetical protein [Bacillota bacterium]WML53294.1 hypothetical protein RCG17_00860 [Neobacillus sp. PS3-12]